jgi:hypothetical protein
MLLWYLMASSSVRATDFKSLFKLNDRMAFVLGNNMINSKRIFDVCML